MIIWDIWSLLTYLPTHPKLGHESYLIWFLELQTQHEILHHWKRKHIYEFVNAGLEHCYIIIHKKIKFPTFSLTPLPHTSGKMLILKGKFEFIKLWQLSLAPTHLLYMSQFLKKKKLGFETKPTHLFGQCLDFCSFFFLTASLSYYNYANIWWKIH